MKDTDKNIVSEWEEAYRQASSLWWEYLEQANKDLLFYTGSQYSEEEKTYLQRQGRTALVYNKILRVVNNICGFQRRNRLGIACEPQEGSDTETADIFSNLLTWNMQSQNGYHTISNAFKGAVITGLNLLETWVDYRKDHEYGDICISREPYNSFLIDPYWNGAADLRDCRFIMRRRFLSKEQIGALLPDERKAVMKIESASNDGKYEYMTYSNKAVGNLLAYDEYYKQVTRPAKLLINKLSGETRIFRGTKKALDAFLNDYAQVMMPTGQPLVLRFGEFVMVKDISVSEVDLNIIVEGNLLYSGKQPSGCEDYPFVPVVGYYEPELDDYSYKLQGVVRCMRDPQTDLNRQRSKILDMINSKASTGWIYKQGSVVNHKDLFKTGQGVQIVMSKESQMGDLQPIVPSDVPQGTFAYTQMIDQDVNGITGVTDENLGLVDAGGQISGTAIKMRQASGTTSLSEFFDNLDLSQKILGQKIINLMQKNWNAQKVERIIGKAPTQEFFEENFGKYDCVVKETNLTDSQRNLAYVQGLQAKAAGIPIPDKFLIEEMPIADKSKLMKYYEEGQAQAQEQQVKIAEAEEMQKALQNSKIVSDLSLAAERRSRMVADEALARERLSQSQLDRARATLEQIKAGKELQEQDIRFLSQTLDLVFKMQEASRQQNRQDVQESSQRAMAQVAVTGNYDATEQAIPELPITMEGQIPSDL